MTEDEIRAILWLLKDINEDRKIGSYYKQQLNIRNTDIKKLIIQFYNFTKMLDEPMKGDLGITMLPNIIVKR